MQGLVYVKLACPRLLSMSLSGPWPWEDNNEFTGIDFYITVFKIIHDDV